MKYKSMFCICKNCGGDALAVVINEGIGTYAYGSAIEYDYRPVVVTNCCEATALDENGNELSVEDVDENFSMRD